MDDAPSCVAFYEKTNNFSDKHSLPNLTQTVFFCCTGEGCFRSDKNIKLSEEFFYEYRYGNCACLGFVCFTVVVRILFGVRNGVYESFSRKSKKSCVREKIGKARPENE